MAGQDIPLRDVEANKERGAAKRGSNTRKIGPWKHIPRTFKSNDDVDSLHIRNVEDFRIFQTGVAATTVNYSFSTQY